MNVPLIPEHAGVLGSQTQVPDAVPLLTAPVPSICHTDPLSLSAYWTLNVDPFGTGFVGTPMVKVSGSTPLPEPEPFRRRDIRVQVRGSSNTTTIAAPSQGHEARRTDNGVAGDWGPPPGT